MEKIEAKSVEMGTGVLQNVTSKTSFEPKEVKVLASWDTTKKDGSRYTGVMVKVANESISVPMGALGLSQSQEAGSFFENFKAKNGTFSGELKNPLILGCLKGRFFN